MCYWFKFGTIGDEKMKTYYLAHNFYDRKQIREWELKIEKKYHINLDNPFYDNDRNDIKELDKLKDGSPEQLQYFKERNTPKMCYDIVEGDLEMIRKSDGLLTIIDNVSIGTSMEIIMASRIYKVPVFVITNIVESHPWIRYFATKIFKTKEEFENWCENER